MAAYLSAALNHVNSAALQQIFSVPLCNAQMRTVEDQHLGMVQAKLQADGINAARAQAQMAQGLLLMQAARPQPAPAPAPATLNANCRSYDRGTYVQTVCD